jgi:exopolysaccharide biosynthesis protein
LQDGDLALHTSSLAEESFWIDRHGPDGSLDVGVVPSDYPDDVDRTRAGRVGVGIDAEEKLLVGVMMGSETRGVKHPELDSAGATLVELAEFLQEMGAVDAINLDGGGSSQLFFLGGLTVVPGNRLGLQSVHYERMVPAIGVVE